jgi:hypothetical protein
VSGGETPRIGLAGRIGDRLNPILLREVNQALRGRAFLVIASLSLLAIVVIALVVAAQGEEAGGQGGEVFLGTLAVLVPILMFLVPLSAFHSMRQEVTRGTVDHLHLSRLGPGTIVRGKLAAAMVQIVLILAIFAPLLGMTFLLRGVDVPTIAASVVLLFLCALGACAFGVACGALCRWPAVFRALPMVAAVGGLGALTVSMIGGGAFMIGMTSLGMRIDLWARLLGIGAPVLGAVLLCGLVGAAALAHPYENRSTGFRLFALTALVVALGWFVGTSVLVRTGSSPWAVAPPPPLALRLARAARDLPDLSAVLAGFLGIFPYFAATEDRSLSPRVRTRVPRSPVLAALATPFLPGSGGGILFASFLVLLGILGGTALPAALGATAFGTDAAFAVIGWLYVFGYSVAAGIVRFFLPRGTLGDWLARATAPALLLVAVFAPLLARTFGWVPRRATPPGPLGFLNPFQTLEWYDGHPLPPGDLVPILGWACVALLVLSLPAIVRGLADVLDASRERRARAQ